MLAYSEGEGAYTHVEASGGAVASTLTSLHPFLRYDINERTSVWGTLGYGTGGLTLTPAGAESPLKTGLSNTMAAIGGRGVLSVRGRGEGLFELALRSDARLSRTTSDTVQGLMSASGATSRVRLMLEGTGTLTLAGNRILKPTLEAGLRYDGGDAETGAGLELGGGLAYTAGRASVEVNARGLVTHADAAYKEWGFSGALRWQPNEDGRGWAVDVGSSWGDAASGVHELWSREDASGFARGGAMDASQRYRIQFGYGVAGRKGRALWVPFFGTDASAGEQAYRMGLKLTSGSTVKMGFELGQRATVGRDPEVAVKIDWSVRW